MYTMFDDAVAKELIAEAKALLAEYQTNANDKYVAILGVYPDSTPYRETWPEIYRFTNFYKAQRFVALQFFIADRLGIDRYGYFPTCVGGVIRDFI